MSEPNCGPNCELRRGDDPALLEGLHAESFADEPWAASEISELLSGPGVFALALWSGSRPLGFAMLRCVFEECEVLTLCIRPGRRRCGLGRALLLGALARAGALGARKVFLEVAEDNGPALRLYGSLGFKPIVRRKNYYRRAKSKEVSALVLSLDLEES